MLRSLARDRRKVWGMDDLVVMPTHACGQCDLECDQTRRNDLSDVKLLQVYNSGGGFCVTDRQAYRLWQTVNLSQILLFELKTQGAKK